MFSTLKDYTFYCRTADSLCTAARPPQEKIRFFLEEGGRLYTGYTADHEEKSHGFYHSVKHFNCQILFV